MNVRAALSKARQEPNALQRWLSRKSFPVTEALGFHVLGNHFYEPVPDTRAVRASYDDGPRELGIDFRLDAAERYALDLAAAYGAEAGPAAAELGYRERNHFFDGLDALLLYGHLRSAKPARVIEVGSGSSTAVIAAALERNAAEGSAPTLVSIDPHDRGALRRAPLRVGLELVRAPLQDVEPEVFERLGQGDLLFVDSSHVHKFGSDVAFAFERVYPALGAGVTVHVHDVFSPYHYPLAWYVRQRRFWNEQHFLETMLRWSDEFRVLLPVHALARGSAPLREAAERYGFRPEGASFYLERVAS